MDMLLNDALRHIHGHPNRAAFLSLGTFLILTGWFFLRLFSSDSLPTHDGLYHYRMASLMAWDKLVVDVDWLPYTVLRSEGTDHQWLWHLLISPFTWFFSDHIGIRMAMAATAAMVPAVFVWIGVKRGVGWPLAFGVAAICMALNMPERIIMLRAQSIAIVFIALFLLLAHLKNFRGLLILSWLFGLSYHAAVILAPLSFVLCLIGLCFDDRSGYKLILAVAGGLALAYIVNPWFPGNIEFLFFHLLFKVLNPDEAAIGVEWVNGSFQDALSLCWPAVLVLTAALCWHCIVAGKQSRLSRETLCWIATATMISILAAVSVRFLEYFTPFAVMAAGFVARDSLAKDRARSVIPALVVYSIVVVMLALGTMRISYFRIGYEDKYQIVSAYLEEHAERGEFIFNLSWSDFVNLFWHSQQFNYVSGLDGNFLLYENPGLYREYQLLGGLASYGASEIKNPAITICNEFNSRWVVVPASLDPDTRVFIQVMDVIPEAVRRVETEWGTLYELACGKLEAHKPG